jgi:hypothetical protein
MALRKFIESEGTSVVQTPIGNIANGVQKVSFLAYAKITSIMGNKDFITANVSFQSDAQQFNRQYHIPVSTATGSANFIAQAYEHLKTLPEFAGAVDC